MDDVPRYRPLAFDKMESLIKEMQEPVTGVQVRTQKIFLTFIPSAFMGYDLVEWLMDRFNLDDANNVEATNLANQLCQHGYFFPINDSKNLNFKDDNSLYRFQSPYYWPWQQQRSGGGGGASSSGGGGGGSAGADNVEYAIYLVKRTLRNKQRHGLEEYELEALANLKKNLAGKWDFITMQAEEQVKLAKERKKCDKIVSDSQERAYWRVVRPPPGMPSALEPCPVPARARHNKPKRRSVHQLRKDVELLKASLDRTRVKVSVALEALASYCDTYAPWDPCVTQPQPANPWVNDDTFFWQINSPIVEIPSEKRVEKWALSLEELVADPTGLQEFTSFLRKEYSHENIRFWLAVMDLRRSSQRQIQRKLNEIYEEFLEKGAPCEINIDGATMEKVQLGLRNPSRFSLDAAADHVYALLLKKDCYPRFVRSEHYRILLNAGRNIQQKKRFFGFGGPTKKKISTGTAPPAGTGASTARRRGSDRSLSGSAHELAISGVAPPPPHSHSQSNLCDTPYREPTDDESETSTWDAGTSSSTTVATDDAKRRVDPGSSPSNSSRRPLTAQNTLDDANTSSRRPITTQSTLDGTRRPLPTQSTLDGGLKGAAPPLRRLSAVESRHLTPLCSSPPLSPKQGESLAPAREPSPPTMAPQPTPTISVSSAPDEQFSAVMSSDKESEIKCEPDKELPATSPGNSERVTEVSASATSTPSADKVESTSEKEIKETVEPAISCMSLATAEECSTSLTIDATVHESDEMKAKTKVRPIGAPLAESEDIGADEGFECDSLVKVPSVSNQNVSNESVACLVQTSDIPQSVMKMDDNKIGTSDVNLRNDICPWEDESSSDGDPPFVKTYSTLGYL